MSENNFEIRTMSREEVNIAVDWAAAEGWNPGLDDAVCFYNADPNGFLVGLLNGEPIATISVIKYGLSFGFLGFYIVKPEFRGNGYGIQIWNAGMEYLAERNVGLDGVVDQQENYKKSGFQLAYRNMRFEGKGGNGVKIEGIETVGDDILNSIIDYDRQFFPEERTTFLKCWLSRENAKALAKIESGEIKGFGVIRKCGIGYKIGPLFADSPKIADELYNSLISGIGEEEKVYLDIPEINDEARKLVKKYNMNLVFETARMYTGVFPDLPIDGLFGVTTFELG